MPVITLTTDFGLNGSYVAAVKGVILGVNPQVTLVDICHTITPQDIAEAAFVFGTAYACFPPGTIHIVVVDPGVGTERRAIALATPTATFVAPDNGVLSYVIHERAPHLAVDGEAGSETLAEAFTIANPEYWRSTVSPTFHARDVFAPVAAHLSLGVPPSELGEKVIGLVTLPLSRPRLEQDGTLVGRVIYIDSFGNLVSDIKESDLRGITGTLAIEVGGRVIKGLSRTYGKGKGLLALIGSSDYVEVAVRDGSARYLLKVKRGDEVRVRGSA